MLHSVLAELVAHALRVVIIFTALRIACRHVRSAWSYALRL